MPSLYFAPTNKKLGDFDLIKKDGKLYCIFIEKDKKKKEVVGETGNAYGLAVSKDGLFWRYLGTVMKPQAKKKKWNNGSLWAMDVFKKNHHYMMLYSAVQKHESDPHSTQQVGLASSIDLKKWKDERKAPVITKDQTKDTYYPKHLPQFCWRDPNVHKVGKTYYCLLAAKDKKRNYETSGCVALLKSEDLVNWETMKPLFSPGKYWELETPHAYKINNKWFLLFGENIVGIDVRYAASEALLGRYRELAFNTLTPSQSYAERITKVGKEYLFYHWIRDGNIGKKETYMAPPKIVETQGYRMFLKMHPELKKHFKKIKGKNIAAEIGTRKNKRGWLRKTTSKKGFSFDIKTKKPDYRKSVFVTKTNKGISVRAYDINNQVKEMRVVPTRIKDRMVLDIFVEGRFLEAYVNDYFVYATTMERSLKNIKKIEIEEKKEPDSLTSRLLSSANLPYPFSPK